MPQVMTLTNQQLDRLIALLKADTQQLYFDYADKPHLFRKAADCIIDNDFLQQKLEQSKGGLIILKTS